MPAHVCEICGDKAARRYMVYGTAGKTALYRCRRHLPDRKLRIPPVHEDETDKARP